MQTHFSKNTKWEKWFYLLIFCAAVFGITGCSRSLTLSEIEALKKDKQFWTWNSTYGPINLHYIEKGSGNQHILLIHGFGANTYTWRYLIKPLEKAGFHVWALDLVGFGLSDKPTTVPYGRDFFVEQILAFMQAKHIPQAHLIGNSMGGGIALAMAVYHPKDVRSLILIDALGYPLDLPFPLKINQILGEVITAFQGRFLIKKFLEQIVFDPNTITEEQIQAYLTPMQMPGGPQAFNMTLNNFDNKQLEEMSQYYHQLQLPILLIWGEEDQWIPIKYYKQFTHDFPKADKQMIPQCGHIPQEECPNAVIERILSFYSSFTPYIR